MMILYPLSTYLNLSDYIGQLANIDIL